MHSVVDYWNGFEVEVGHAVNLELESKCWFEMTVDAVLVELVAKGKDI